MFPFLMNGKEKPKGIFLLVVATQIPTWLKLKLFGSSEVSWGSKASMVILHMTLESH